MRNFFKRKLTTPIRIASDDVTPVHYFDDNPILRNIIANFLLKFDDVLDPELLRQSLEQLLSKNGWRKLTARLRLNELGKLEYHIPKCCNVNRPAFTYSHVSHDMTTAEHPVARRLPSPTTYPGIVADPNEFHSLMRPDDGPRDLADFLYTDLPQLGVHVVSFRDATLVSLTWPHTLFDGMGQKELFQAWSLVLQGRDDEVRPLQGVEDDPLAEFGLDPEERYKHADRVIKGKGLLALGLRISWDSIWQGEEARVLCIPGSYVRALRDTAMRELVDTGGNADEEGAGYDFVSEGDVLCAWLARIALSQQRHKTSVSVMNAIDIRSLLAGPDDLLPADRAYVSNAVLGLFALLNREDIMSKPLGHVAAAIRRSIAELGTRGQAEAYVATARQSQTETGYPPAFGDPWTQGLVFSNWSKINYFAPDFSAARSARGGDRWGSKPPSKPTYIQMLGFYKGMSLRHSFSIMGKDNNDNYWVNAVLPKGAWRSIASESREDLSKVFVLPDIRPKL